MASTQQANEDASRLLSSITSASGQATTYSSQLAQAFTDASAKTSELIATNLKADQANKANQAAATALIGSLAAEASAQRSKEKTEAALQLSATLEKASNDLKLTETSWHTEAQAGMKEFKESSSELLTSKQTELDAMTVRLASLEDQIKIQIQKAIGVSLFGAFQARQERIVSSKRLWQWALLGCVVAAVVLGGYFAYELSQVQPSKYAYFAKLAISLPVIYAISFCSLQYGKERRLEEEYAFKASISVSLNPYRELIGKLSKMDDAAERIKFTDFIIASVTNVFTSPTDKVYETHHSATEPDSLDKTVKQIKPILDPILSHSKNKS